MNKRHQIYNDIEIDSDVLSASPHRLILLLLEKCITHIDSARAFMISRDYKNKGRAIVKASDIVNYLRSCLRYDDTGAQEISYFLGTLYQNLQNQLLKANINNQTDELEKAKNVLVEIKSRWEGLNY